MGKYHALKDRVGGLETDLARTREEVATLTTRVDNLKNIMRKDDQKVRDNVAELGADLSDLQMMLGRLQGRQEEIDFKLNAIAKHVKGLKGLVEDRFGVDSGILPKDLPKSPGELFELGMSTFKSGLTRKARAIFQEFMRQFKEHDKTDDAQFMLGETLFAEGRFTESVTAYKLVYDQYQTGDRYEEAVLRIGLAYVRSNRCRKALKIYRFARKTFKGTPTAEAAAAEIEKLDKVCK